MGPIGMPELVIILLIVIVIFGANRLPQLGRGIGTAIKKNPQVRTQTPALIPQAIIRDRDTFIDATFQAPEKSLARQ